jgi:hypothetical protein
LGNLYLKGIDPKCSQSRGIEEIASLGQELAQLEKTTKSSTIQRGFGGKVTSQRGTRTSYVTPTKNPKKSSSKHRQQRAPKITTKEMGKPPR